MVNDEERSEKTLRQSFEEVENVVQDVEDGRLPIRDLQIGLEKAIGVLEELTREISSLGLFSVNEAVEELPTFSLPFLLLPCYLGVLQQNKTVPIPSRLQQLTLAQAYFRDYLTRTREYGVTEGEFPWEKDTEAASTSKPAKSAEDTRQEKIQRFREQQDQKEAMRLAKKAYEDSKGNDDEQLRKQYLCQLKYWCLKLIDEIKSIDEEKPLLEMMIQRGLQSGDQRKEKSEPAPKPPPLKPFIIARSQKQKKVFGLGYPAVPTMTVDEWYDKRFANGPPPSTSAAKTHSHGDDEPCQSGEEDSDEDESEAKRLQKMNFDEYKDWHRRGWGNTHNKG